MSEVKLENVSKKFGDTNAVSDLSFTVKDGEFFVLLGPTGAGKTTTLRLIAGLEQADEGKIFINNEDTTQFQPAQRDVAFVFQQYSLYPNYTVYNNLAFPLRSPLRSLTKGEIDKIVRGVAKTLHIEDKLTNKATHLSGGEMQRVALGRALVREPNIFLMDEPLSSLDAKLREELRLELKNIQVHLGATLLFVTHDHVEATTMADRIGIIKEGKLIQIDPPEKIYDDPNSIYVATKLGSPRINVVPSRLLNMELPAKVEYAAFRPENVLMDRKGTMAAQIETIQNLGVEEIATMRFMGEQIRAVVKPESLSRSDKDVNITVKKEDMLFFDNESKRVYL